MQPGWVNNQGVGWGQMPAQGSGHMNQQNHQQVSLFNDNQMHIIITALDKKLALDAAQDHKNRNKMILWKRHGQKNQQFMLKWVNGKYQIISGHGFMLDGSNIMKGDDQVRVELPNNSAGQYWDIIPVEGQPNMYYIRSFCNKVLDVFKCSAKKGIKVILWDFNAGKNQKWYIQPL